MRVLSSALASGCGSSDDGEDESDGELGGYFSVPHDDPPRWLFVFTAYLDETGQDTKDWVFIAGFLGKKEHWDKFIPLWKEGLGTQRKSLHMADLRFKKDRDRQLLERLAPIPLQSGLEPVLGGICVNHYEDLLMGDSFLEKVHCGYLSALWPLLVQVLRWLPPNERIEIVFEQQERYFGITDFALSKMRNLAGGVWQCSNGKPKLAKWSSVPKGSTCLTEPADYFAYAMAQYYKDKTSVRSKWTQPIIKSVDTVQAIGAVMEREQAREAISRLVGMLKLENIVLPGSGEEFEKFRALANRVSKIPLEEREKLQKEIEDEES